jgi:hypothetical protein
MNLPEEEDFITRRNKLAHEIARQRGELTNAYRKLEAPIRYTEYGMKSFAFIRQNQWVLTAAPALLGSIPSIIGLVSSVFGKKRKKQPMAVQHTRSPEVVSSGPVKKMSRLSQALMAGAEQGIRAYNIYRRVRSLIP